MTKKQVNIFSIVFLIIIAGIIIFTRIGVGSLRNDLQNLEIENISAVSFYKDSIRDSECLHAAVTEMKDLQELLNCITDMQRTRTSVKSYTKVKEVKVHLNIETDSIVPLELNIMHMEELGDQALIKVNVMKKNGFTDGGVYLSDKFFPWLQTLSNRAEFEKIWELR